MTRSGGDLAESAGVVDLLFARAPVGIALVDPEQRYVRVNETLAQINGIPARAHVGRSAEEVVPDVAVSIRARVTHVLATGERCSTSSSRVACRRGPTRSGR